MVDESRAPGGPSPIERVLARLERVHGAGTGKWTARCPAHEDHNPSLSVRVGDDEQVLLNCHAGCDARDIVAAMSLTMADLFVPRPIEPSSTDVTPITYDYTDDDGRLVFQVVRKPGKQFRQRRPDGKGGWVWNMEGVQRVPYRLPAVTVAVLSGKQIYVVEGERDVHSLERLGLVATCNSGGAGKFTEDHATHFAGASEVIVIADNDDPGRAHAQQVMEMLRPHVRDVLLLELPDVAPGGDVTDWIAAGGTKQGLGRLMIAAEAPEPEPDPADAVEEELVRARIMDGEQFILNAPQEIPAIWGEGDEVLWAKGEALILAGPSGVGKTTIAQQVVLACIGIRSDVLGLPVVGDRRVLYIAADRPEQARRSFTRMVGQEHAQTLRERLVVWRGPLDEDLVKKPEALLELARKQSVDMVFIDSLKDVARDLHKDEGGTGYNRARQLTVAAGVDLLELHHQRKGQDGRKPTKVDDVYGSVWITAGSGSVVLLWGEPGDSCVEMSHLKQPADTLGPWNLVHDHTNGTTVVEAKVDAWDHLKMSGATGITALAVAQYYKDGDPARNDIEKARRKLEALVKKGWAHKVEGTKGGNDRGIPARYFPISGRTEQP